MCLIRLASVQFVFKYIWLLGRVVGTLVNWNVIYVVQPFSWFHGKLDRTEAEMRLSEILTPGAYLVRQSVNSPDTYSISFISSQGIIHFRILFHTGSYFIGGRRFTCLSDIVGYYIGYSSIVASETLKIPVPPKQVCVV